MTLQLLAEERVGRPGRLALLNAKAREDAAADAIRDEMRRREHG